MFDCVLEILSIDNVPSSVYGGRPNLIIRVGLLDQSSPAPSSGHGFLPNCKASQRSSTLPHAPSSVTTDEVFEFVGCDEKEVLVVSVHDHDDDTPKGFLGSVHIPVGGAGKMHGVRNLKCTTDLGLLTGSGERSEDPSPIAIQVMWRIDEAGAPAAEGLMAKWEHQYQQRVRDVYHHSTANTVTSIAESRPLEVPYQTNAAAHQGAPHQQQPTLPPRSFPLPTPLSALHSAAASLNTSVDPPARAPNKTIPEAPNPYHPYLPGMFVIPALSPDKTAAPVDAPLTATTLPPPPEASQPSASATNVRPVVVRKDTCIDACKALSAILSAPTRRLTSEEEVLVVAYAGPLLACTPGARSETIKVSVGGSSIPTVHAMGHIPNLSPHHVHALEAAAFFSGRGAPSLPGTSSLIAASTLSRASAQVTQSSLSIAAAPAPDRSEAMKRAAPGDSRPQSPLKTASLTTLPTPAGSRPGTATGKAWEKSITNRATSVRITANSLASGPARW